MDKRGSILNPIEGESFALHLKVNCPKTKPGETLVATGSCTELGNWIPDQGLRLLTSEKDFPIWFGGKLIKLKKASSQKNSVFEYKYVILNESDG